MVLLSDQNVEIFKTLKYKIKTTSKQSTMKSMIVLAAISSIFLIVLPLVSLAYAATGEKEYVKIRNEIWNLFFRMTTAAFVVGAVVSGTLIWLVWRFRESHPKNKQPTKWETGEAH